MLTGTGARHAPLATVKRPFVSGYARLVSLTALGFQVIGLCRQIVPHPSEPVGHRWFGGRRSESVAPLGELMIVLGELAGVVHFVNGPAQPPLS
jgi:hypothetical protein